MAMSSRRGARRPVHGGDQRSRPGSSPAWRGRHRPSDSLCRSQLGTRGAADTGRPRAGGGQHRPGVGVAAGRNLRERPSPVRVQIRPSGSVSGSELPDETTWASSGPVRRHRDPLIPGWVEGAIPALRLGTGILGRSQPRLNRFGNEFLLSDLGFTFEKPLQQDVFNLGFFLRYFAGANAALGAPKGGIGGFLQIRTLARTSATCTSRPTCRSSPSAGWTSKSAA